VVVLLSVKSLSDMYANNPKQRPNDLRDGFDYVRGQTLTFSAFSGFAPSTGVVRSGRCWSRSLPSSTNSPISTRNTSLVRTKLDQARAR
jgi:hypothetical protein